MRIPDILYFCEFADYYFLNVCGNNSPSIRIAISSQV